jgi:hypothetical protein
MTRTYIIADDSMEGRETGKRGGLRSASYIASELKRLGLEPAGDNGAYFQAIPWVTRSPDSTSSLTVGGASLTWSMDFIVMPKLGFALALGGQPFGAGFDGADAPTIYGGRIGDSTIAPADARGKVVVFAPAATNPSFNFFLEDDLRRFADAKAIVVATSNDRHFDHDVSRTTNFLEAAERARSRDDGQSYQRTCSVHRTSHRSARVQRRRDSSRHRSETSELLRGDRRASRSCWVLAARRPRFDSRVQQRRATARPRRSAAAADYRRPMGRDQVEARQSASRSWRAARFDQQRRRR